MGIRGHLPAIPPPRGRPGEGPMDSPFRIEYLDAERLLPVLVRKAAWKGLRDARQAGPECADLCPPTYEASPTRWT